MTASVLHNTLLTADWHWRTLYRWLIAWWYYRSGGMACWIADADEEHFWKRMLRCALTRSAVNPLGRYPWPRGEGQHWFRGLAAAAAITEAQFTWGDMPEDMVRSFINAAPHFGELDRRVSKYVGLDRNGTPFVIGTDLHSLGLGRFNFPDRLPWAYPSINLRTELGPWAAHSERAAELLLVLRKDTSP
jgi:hypothetical protein